MTSTGPKSLQEEINDMPLVDEDAPEVFSDDDDAGRGGAVAAAGNIPHEMSIESMSSGIGSPANVGHQPPNGEPEQEEGAEGGDEMAEEKERLIQQIMELQNTLDDLSMRVDSVKEENLKLRSENQVLSQYIENLMSASNVFQSTSPNKTSSGGKKKGKK